MANPHTVQLINFYKNQILNHIGPTAYVAMMTNGEFKSNPRINLKRIENGHAHIRFQTFTLDKNFKRFNDAVYAYVTSSIFEVDADRCLTLRKELIVSWGTDGDAYKRTHVFLIDEVNSNIYDIPVSNLLDLYNKNNTKTRHNDLFNRDYVAFNLDDLEQYAEKMNNEEYKGVFDASFWDAKFIGNTKYSKFRANKSCKLAVYDIYGKRVLLKAFRSIGEAYDMISKISKIEISQSTLQRKAKTATPIVTDKGNTVYVVRDDIDFDLPETMEVAKTEVEKICNESVEITTVKTTEDYDAEEAEKINNMTANEIEELVEDVTEKYEVIESENSPTNDDFDGIDLPISDERDDKNWKTILEEYKKILHTKDYYRPTQEQQIDSGGIF